MKFERKGYKREKECTVREVKPREMMNDETEFKWSIDDDVVDDMLAELREIENLNHE